MMRLGLKADTPSLTVTPQLSQAMAQLSERFSPSNQSKSAPSAKADADPEIVHFLNRTTFGYTEQELELASSMGIADYLDLQLNPDAIDDQGLEQSILQAFPTLSLSYQEILDALRNDEQPNTAFELIIATTIRQLYSPKQLFEVMTEFWTNHFNVFILDDLVQYLKTGDDRDQIRPNVFGKFIDLLNANATSPAMQIYLDNFSNTKDGPNENYSRELMELHTLGVNGGYTEFDVQEVAKCFTGWTLSAEVPGLFVFAPELHDITEKFVLGQTIPANGGIEDGQMVLQILADSPSTASFIASKLCVRFVSDIPPQSIIDKVANTYTATDGDVPEMLRTLFLSPEFSQSKSEKFKRPSEFVGSVTRRLGATLQGGGFQTLFQQLQTLGQLPFFAVPPTGYDDEQPSWLNTGALLNRWNFTSAVANGNLPAPGDRLPGDDGRPGMTIDERIQIPINDLIGAARTPEALVDVLTERVLHQQIDSQDRESLISFASFGQDRQARLSRGIAAQIGRGVISALLASRYFQAR